MGGKNVGWLKFGLQELAPASNSAFRYRLLTVIILDLCKVRADVVSSVIFFLSYLLEALEGSSFSRGAAISSGLSSMLLRMRRGPDLLYNHFRLQVPAYWFSWRKSSEG